MAIVYYPKDQFVALRDTSNAAYEQLFLASSPNTVLYFDTSSGLNVASASQLFITASWAGTASVSVVTTFVNLTASISSSWASQSLSSSFATTSSFAINAGGSSGTTLFTGSTYQITSSWSNNSLSASVVGPYVNYSTIVTSSTKWITCSFNNPLQLVNIPLSASYSFTSSDHPVSGQMSDITLYINNTSAFTSSVSFPVTWKNLGAGWPTSISSSKVAMLALRAIDTNTVVGTWNVQL